MTPEDVERIRKALEPIPGIRSLPEWTTCLDMVLDSQPRMFLEMGRNGALMPRLDSMATMLVRAKENRRPTPVDGQMNRETGEPVMMSDSMAEAEIIETLWPTPEEEEEPLTDKERTALENLLRQIATREGLPDVPVLL